MGEDTECAPGTLLARMSCQLRKVRLRLSAVLRECLTGLTVLRHVWQSHKDKKTVGGGKATVVAQACGKRHLCGCREGRAAGRATGGWRGRLRDAALRAHEAGRDLLHQRVQLHTDAPSLHID